MPRLPYPSAVSPQVQELLDARPPRNVFRMLAHAEALMPGLMELTGAILYRAKLDPALRELAILRVGKLCGSAYEVEQHRKIAKAVGLSDEKVEGALHFSSQPIFTAKESLLLRFVDSVKRDVKAPDDLFSAVVEALGPEQTVELLILIGTYIMLAQVLENAGVELEGGTGPADADVARIFGKQKS
ncbi:MAG: carboxymuconolactone decarboxylase family protein [Betaproteobacteria bacterium]|nr:carboxymuconolactone decarboxylase family protein [Betaproteobacteria bacterium]